MVIQPASRPPAQPEVMQVTTLGLALKQGEVTTPDNRTNHGYTPTTRYSPHTTPKGAACIATTIKFPILGTQSRPDS